MGGDREVIGRSVFPQARQRACSSCSVVSRAPWLSQASRLTSATLSSAMPTLCSILAPA